MPADNTMKDHTLRLPSRIVSVNGICGCGSTSRQDFFQCCQVLDLGTIYELEPNYSENNPCAPTRFDSIEGDPPECVITPDEEPYGEVSDYVRACAKMVVWENATIEGSNLNFETRKTYYSRQRNGLPKFNEDACERPIYCPAENGLSECCVATNGEIPFNNQIGGPYLNCEIILPADGYSSCTLSCNSDFKEQIFKFGMSNCELEYEDQNSELQKVILAGYAIDSNDWWFLDSSEFEDMVDQIKENNPNGQFPQTIYAHFQVEWKYIKCNSNGGIQGAPCNGAGRINYRIGPCGDSRTQGLVDKDERERSVRIKAAIGFSLGGCGFQPEKACEKIYETN